MSRVSDQTNVNSETSDQEANTAVERQPIFTAEEPVYVRRPVEAEEVVVVEREISTLSELLKFGVLAVILLGTPLVIALLIPLIFGQIVPAILGSDLPGNTQTVPGDQVIQPPTAETPEVTLPTDPQTGIGGDPEPTPTPFIPTETPTPEAATHIVQTGDTLSSIARQYGLTANEIAQANNINNPNQIFLGQELIIPVANNPYP